MSSFSIYRNCVIRDNLIGGALLLGTGHNMLSCRFSGNRRVQVEIGHGATANLDNCLIIGNAAGNAEQPPADGVYMEYGRLDHCTIVNSKIGLSVGIGASVKNSVIQTCSQPIVVASKAVETLVLDHTILGPGNSIIGDQKVSQDNWADVAWQLKLSATTTIDTLALEAPLYRLNRNAPAESEPAPGANLELSQGYTPLVDDTARPRMNQPPGVTYRCGLDQPWRAD